MVSLPASRTCTSSAIISGQAFIASRRRTIRFAPTFTMTARTFPCGLYDFRCELKFSKP